MAKKMVIQDFLLRKHDHLSCIEEAVRRAEAVCETKGERFTPLRRAVLQLVWEEHKPVKAYDLLARLAETHERPAPPTVYRALDFLQEAGLVHKLQSLNAYLGCADPERRHRGQFLICRSCGRVAELDDEALTSRIDANAKKLGFEVNDETIEISGLCQQCR